MTINRDKTEPFLKCWGHTLQTCICTCIFAYTYTLAYTPAYLSCIYIHLHNYLSVAAVFLTAVVKGLARSTLRMRRSLFGSQFEGIIPSWWGKYGSRSVRQLAAWRPLPGSRTRQMLLLRALSPFFIFLKIQFICLFYLPTVASSPSSPPAHPHPFLFCILSERGKLPLGIRKTRPVKLP